MQAGSSAPRISGAWHMARLRALAVFLFCPAVTVGEFYLPSFVASRSGVTRPERKTSRGPSRADGGTFNTAGMRDKSLELEQRHVISSIQRSSCGGAPTAWAPLSLDAQTRAYQRHKRQHEGSMPAGQERKIAREIKVTSPWDDGSSPTAMTSMCSKEGKVALDRGNDKGRAMLAKCLQEENVEWCPGGDRPSINSGISTLKGLSLMEMPPKCMIVNKGTCPPTSEPVNKETGRVRAPARARNAGLGRGEAPVPPRDLARNSYRRCAIVGNGPALSKAENGKYIDRFDAVFRFNSITNTDPVMGRELHVGKKTTFRLFNRVTSIELAEGLYKLKPSAGEKWIFWHQNSKLVLGAIQKRFPGVSVYMMSSAEINWQVQVYFQLRRDLRALGFGPFACPSNLNTGLHAILMAQHLCQQVGTFGISHNMAESLGRFSADNHTISRFHAWDFETLLIRLLYFGGKLDVCNA